MNYHSEKYIYFFILNISYGNMEKNTLQNNYIFSLYFVILLNIPFAVTINYEDIGIQDIKKVGIPKSWKYVL